MPSVYRAADLFVYPNPRYESFGIVFLEAMASNLPVIATDDPIRREIVGKAGLFIDSNDPSSITNAIKKALKINWQQRPRQQAIKFSWEKAISKYQELFLKLNKENI
jgi:glycosyltransferase involved in cell wall biosynthesis